MKDLKLWATVLTVTIIAWAISTTVTGSLVDGFITAGYVFGGFAALLGIFAAADYLKYVVKVTPTEWSDLEASRAAASQ